MPDTSPELWTVQQTADYLGITEPSARKQASLWKITRTYVPNEKGRVEVRYSADEIREKRANPPRRGRPPRTTT